jgi:hypothetical protein
MCLARDACSSAGPGSQLLFSETSYSNEDRPLVSDAPKACSVVSDISLAMDFSREREKERDRERDRERQRERQRERERERERVVFVCVCTGVRAQRGTGGSRRDVDRSRLFGAPLLNVYAVTVDLAVASEAGVYTVPM